VPAGGAIGYEAERGGGAPKAAPAHGGAICKCVTPNLRSPSPNSTPQHNAPPPLVGTRTATCRQAGKQLPAAFTGFTLHFWGSGGGLRPPAQMQALQAASQARHKPHSEHLREI